jgi:hypothetical protein
LLDFGKWQDAIQGLEGRLSGSLCEDFCGKILPLFEALEGLSVESKKIINSSYNSII